MTLHIRWIVVMTISIIFVCIGILLFFWHRFHTPGAYMARADAAAAQGRYRDAIPLLRQTVRLEPRSKVAHTRLADALMQVNYRYSRKPVRSTNGKIENSIMVECYPASPAALSEAEREYTTAIQLWPSNQFLYRKLADVYSEQKRYDVAIREYHLALSVFPKTKTAPMPETSIQERYQYDNDQQLSTMHESLADCYASLHQYAKAIPEMQAAISYGDDEPFRHLDLGDYYLGNNQAPQARTEWLIAEQQAKTKQWDSVTKQAEEKLAQLLAASSKS